MSAGQTVFPVLRITDEARARLFYIDGLGFALDWEHRFGPEFPVFMQISKEGLALRLSGHAGDGSVGGMAHLDVADVDAWYAAARGRGVVTDRGPEDQPWGMRDVRFRDPDGNQVVVGTRVG